MNYERALACASEHAKHLAYAHARASRIAEGVTNAIAADLARASHLSLWMAREIGLDLTGALTQAEELVRAHAHARDLAVDLSRKLALARVLHRHPTLGRQRTMVDTLVSALEQTENVSVAEAHVNELLNGFSRHLDGHCGDMGYGLAHVHILDLPRGIRNLTRVLRDAHAHAILDLGTLNPAADPNVDGVPASARPGAISRRLVAWAVQLLPAAQRPRYAEEFRSELWHLPQHLRFMHAARIFYRSWALRRTLIGMRMAQSARNTG